jgi:hypothetical protein
MSLRERIAAWLLGNRYDAEQYSTSRSYIPTTIQGARFDANYSARLTMLAKARDCERNSALVNRMADLWEEYTVGTGLQLQPASSDAEWNKRAAPESRLDCTNRDIDIHNRATHEWYNGACLRCGAAEGGDEATEPCTGVA